MNRRSLFGALVSRCLIATCPIATCLIAASLVAACLLPGGVAYADNAVRGADVELTDEALVVSVAADEAIGAPRIRTEPGFVRVWLPALRTDSLNPRADGTVVRSVRLRPGFDDTTAIMIRLGDDRDVGRRAVTVERSGRSANIRIARSALPGSTPTLTPSAPETQAQTDATALAPAPTGARPEPAAAPSAATAPTSANAADSNGADSNAADSSAAAQAETPPSAAGSTTAGDDASSSDGAARPLALTRRASAQPIPVSAGTPTTLILVISAILGGALLLVKTVSGKRKGNGPARDIEVVASKRVGARHQIMVVRALGRDYLLSVNGGRTEKLASLPAVGGSAAADAGDESFGPLLGLAKRERRASSDEPSNGSDLLRALAQRNDAVQLARSAPSEAVAGLLRLRQRAGRA